MSETPEKPGYILILEEDTRTIQILEFHLGRKGYLMEFSSDSTKALARIQEEQPLLVILSDQTAGITGTEFIALLRQNPSLSNLPVILLRAGQNRGDYLGSYGNAFLEGVSILKPFNPQEILSHIKRIIAQLEQR